MDLCKQSGYPLLDPVYIVIYVDCDAGTFVRRFQIPKYVGRANHALFVERVQPFVSLADRGKHRPVMGGISVGNASRSDSGTLGGFVESIPMPTFPLILSCNHVLVDPASSTKAIIQQGPSDGGRTSDVVAHLSFQVPLKPPKGYSYGAPYNSVDVALAQLAPRIAASSMIRALSRVTGLRSVGAIGIGDPVVFVGKESDRMTATITRFLARVKISINGTKFNFGDLFEMRSRIPLYFRGLASPGDSGAWVITDVPRSKRRLCGVLVAGNGKLAMACFAENALMELGNLARTRFRLFR